MRVVCPLLTATANGRGAGQPLSKLRLARARCALRRMKEDTISSVRALFDRLLYPFVQAP